MSNLGLQGKPRPLDEPMAVLCNDVAATDTRPIGLGLPPGLPKFAMSHVALPRGPQDPVWFKPVSGEDQQFVVDMLRAGYDGNGDDGGGGAKDTRCAYVHAFLSIKCKGEQAQWPRAHVPVAAICLPAGICRSCNRFKLPT